MDQCYDFEAIAGALVFGLLVGALLIDYIARLTRCENCCQKEPK